MKETYWSYMIVEVEPDNLDMLEDRYEGCTFREYLNRLGLDGWELVSVYPSQTKRFDPVPSITDITVVHYVLKRRFEL